MAKIEATESRKFKVRCALERAYASFADPEQIKRCFVDLERFELLSPNSARWVQREKAEKGVRFQADYSVVYEGNGRDQVSWKSIAGNLDTQGTVSLRELPGGELEIDYRETLAPDLPIPKLAAMVFKPIVAREVRQGIANYLDRVERLLNSND